MIEPTFVCLSSPYSVRVVARIDIHFHAQGQEWLPSSPLTLIDWPTKLDSELKKIHASGSSGTVCIYKCINPAQKLWALTHTFDKFSQLGRESLNRQKI